MSETLTPYGSDEMLEKQIGRILKDLRLERNVNQTDLAKSAGLSRRTITSVEHGEGCTLITLIRLLRALNHLELLEPLLTERGPSPIELFNQAREPKRKYASKPRKSKPTTPWVWGDEKP